MANLPTKAHLTSSTTTEAQFQSAIGQLYDFLGQGFQSSGFESLTIASGVVTPTKGCIVLSSEGGTATDDLTNIVPTNIGDKIVLIKALQNITLKHNSAGTGKIFLQNDVDVVLDDLGYTIALMYDTATTRWNEVWRSFGLICPSATALAQARAALGLGSAAYQATTAFATAAQGALAETALQPGEVSSGIQMVRTVYTTSGTWTKPTNLLYADVEVIGGGGGGGSGNASNSTGSAGGGGGTSSFGGHCSASGGGGGGPGGGPAYGANSYRGEGGAGTGGNLNVSGNPGAPGVAAMSGGLAGGAGTYGNLGSGGQSGRSDGSGIFTGGSGGAGGYSRKLIAAADITTSTVAVTVGAGGARGNTGYVGVAGVQGVVIVTEYRSL